MNPIFVVCLSSVVRAWLSRYLPAVRISLRLSAVVDPVYDLHVPGQLGSIQNQLIMLGLLSEA